MKFLLLVAVVCALIGGGAGYGLASWLGWSWKWCGGIGAVVGFLVPVAVLLLSYRGAQ